jgi:hypothetical protein
MPHRSPELSLVAIAARPARPQGSEPAGPGAGPGWFDSSWELHRGLEVREGWSDDERVHGWIEDFLAAQRVLDRIVSPSEIALVD